MVLGIPTNWNSLINMYWELFSMIKQAHVTCLWKLWALSAWKREGYLISLQRKVNTRNVRFQWSIHIINPVDKTKLSCNTLHGHQRSNTVSLETWHPYLLVYWWQCSSLYNNTVDWDEEIDSMLSLVCRSSLGCEILRCSPSCNLWWWRHHSLMGQLVSSLCSCSFRASGCCSLNLFEAINRLLYSWSRLLKKTKACKYACW